jgi:hypothetical protein
MMRTGNTTDEPRVIEHALFGAENGAGPALRARSTGFRDDWLAEADRLRAGFGQRPPGVACPEAVFALPLDGTHVAVVRAADHGDALAFYLLALPHVLYADLGGDPFHLADQYPPPWQAQGELQPLAPPQPAPYRSVEAVRKALDVPNSATLLGGIQALVDGGRLVFERSGPDPHLLRSLWLLLPTATRAELWPTTFAFSNAHGFDVAVLPRARGPEVERYVTEEVAGDYPEGRYELAVQTAAENSDQDDLDRLFSRRSRSQTLKLAVALLLAFILVPLLANILFGPGPFAPRTPPEQPKDAQPAKERDK